MKTYGEYIMFMNSLVIRYWSADDLSWAPLHEWRAEDIVELEVLANAELQRRAYERTRSVTYVDGPQTAQ